MILEVQGVDQVFRTGFWMRPVKVLHGVSLQVPEKSVFGFLGANGAGKTTLIQLIVGLREPTAGEIRVAGHRATSRAARAQLGYLPERPYFYDHLTGEELLGYFGTLSGLSRARIQERIPRVLEAVGMSHARKVELRKYSKGMLQRIGIAQAILHDPRFLVLDEPMSGLDPLGRKEMRELIVRLASEGRTIFFSSHVIPDLEAICDQVALLQKGRLMGCGPISQLVKTDRSQTEVGFTGLPIEKARAIAGLESIREMGDGARAIVPDEKVNEAVAQLIQARARILWVTPIRPSLESFFERKPGGPGRGGYDD